MKATPVNLPLEAPMWWSGGLYPGTTKAIIEVETDEGLIGLGEAPSADLANLVESIGDALVGADPLDIGVCERRSVAPWQIVQNTDDSRSVRAFGGLEIALWDLRGKHASEPLHQLLGGTYRTEIPFTEYFGFRQQHGAHGGEMTAEAVAEYCVAMREQHGSTMFEGKLSLGDPALEVRTVRLLREALSDEAMLRLDSNMQWSMATAQRVLREIEPYNIRNYEDPVATFEELRALRLHSSIPFSSHVPDIRRAIALGVPDAFVLTFAALGGITRTVRFVGACEAMGLGFWCYSGDSGICTAAYLHLVASQPWITEPSQSLLRWQIADVIAGGPFEQTDNVVQVPTGPGLGVQLDPDALTCWHNHLKEHGTLSHFIDPVTPGQYRTLPLH